MRRDSPGWRYRFKPRLRRPDVRVMDLLPGDPVPSPHPQPATDVLARGRLAAAPASPPPLPRPVHPLGDFYSSAAPARPTRWPAAAALVAAAAYFAGMTVLNAARARPAGPPSASDLLLACGVFPLALILGFF